MSSRRILIVGGVAGGASCAARARRLDEDAEIVMFERGPYPSFANCGLPYHVGGEIKDRAKLIVQSPERLHKVLNIDVRVNSEVKSIDRAKKEVEVKNLQTGEVYRERYDALVLAPGAGPLRPPIPGIERAGQFTLRNIPDMDAIIAWVDGQSAKRAVVVGGGYIGLEMAEQLKVRGLDVTVVELLPQVMAPLDPEMAAHLHEEIRRNGIRLILADSVAEFVDATGGAKASTVVLKSGERIPADIVVLGLGVRPEVWLAKDAGLELGALGGIRVDDRMRTSDSSIYAAGDVVEVVYHPVGKAALLPLAGPANRQGRIAADNICGVESRFGGVIGTAVLRLFSLSAACTGANEKMLQKNGMRYQAVHLHPMNHAGYYPGASPIAMKLLFDPESGKVLGAQAVGKDGVDKRIDVIATAMKFGATVEDMAELELCYAPPFGSAKDPVNLAGMIAQNIRNGLGDVVQWHEIAALQKDPAVLILDVRDKAERDQSAIENSKHIPLAELRGRLGELPKDKEIIVHCASGQRSNMAMRILVQRGFKARNLTGSMKTWLAGKS